MEQVTFGRPSSFYNGTFVVDMIDSQYLDWFSAYEPPTDQQPWFSRTSVWPDMAESFGVEASFVDMSESHAYQWWQESEAWSRNEDGRFLEPEPSWWADDWVPNPTKVLLRTGQYMLPTTPTGWMTVINPDTGMKGYKVFSLKDQHELQSEDEELYPAVKHEEFSLPTPGGYKYV